VECHVVIAAAVVIMVIVRGRVVRLAMAIVVVRLVQSRGEGGSRHWTSVGRLGEEGLD